MASDHHKLAVSWQPDGNDDKDHGCRRRLHRKAMAVCARIDDNVVSEIISRAPWKSICRFTCVSTRWRDMINSSTFLKLLQSLCAKEAELFAGFFHQNVDEDDTDTDFLKVKFFTPFVTQTDELAEELLDRGSNLIDKNMGIFPSDFHIQGCQHGLLLLTSYIAQHLPQQGAFNEEYRLVNRNYVCHPITGRYYRLPDPPYDESIVNVKVGFLVDQQSGNYILVQASVDYYLIPSTFVQLYSSLTNAWELRQYTWLESDGNGGSKYWAGNEVLNMPTCTIENAIFWIDRVNMVVCCDIEKETFRSLRAPACCEKSFKLPCLGVYNGVLRYAAADGNYSILIWEHREGEWEVLGKVPPCPIPVSWQGYYFNQHRILNCSDKEIVYIRSGDIVFSYNFVTKKFETRFGSVTPQIMFPYFLPKFPSLMF